MQMNERDSLVIQNCGSRARNLRAKTVSLIKGVIGEKQGHPRGDRDDTLEKRGHPQKIRKSQKCKKNR